MTDLNNTTEISLTELDPQEVKDINGGNGAVVPCDENECPVHDPDNPLDEYIIIH